MILDACSSLVLIQRTYDDGEVRDSDREEEETGLDGDDEELASDTSSDKEENEDEEKLYINIGHI